MANENGFIEKRVSERVAAKIQVRFEAIPDDQAERLIHERSYKDLTQPMPANTRPLKDVMTVVTENISVGGLKLVGDKPFEEGHTLSVELILPQMPMPIKALAMVVRADRNRNDEGRYTAGLRFLAINKDDVARVERYVAMLKRASIEKKNLQS